jgi:hypothetical protein
LLTRSNLRIAQSSSDANQFHHNGAIRYRAEGATM